MDKRARTFVSMGILLAFVAAACAPGAAPTATRALATPASAGGAPATSPPLATPTPAPAAKGPKKLIVGLSTLGGEQVDPYRYTGGMERPLYWAMSAGMLTYDLEGKLSAYAAESWQVTSEGWKFTLRPGLKFHNGQPITVEDAQFGFQRQLRDELFKGGTVTQFKAQMDRAEVVDSRTLMVYTKGPRPAFGDVLEFGAQLAPKDHITKVGDEAFAKQPVLAGPFKLVKQVIGESVEMDRFADFFGKKANYDGVLIKIVPEPATQMAMLKAGEVDVIDNVVGDLATEVDAYRDTHVVWTVGTAAPFIRLHDVKNPQRKDTTPLRFVEVRQALNYALDKKKICETLYKGQCITGFVYNTPLGNAYDPNYAGAKDPYPYNPAKAKELLAKAGYPNGFSIELGTTISPSSPFLPELAQLSQTYFNAIGVKTTIYFEESGTYYAKQRDKSAVGMGMSSHPTFYDMGPQLESGMGCKGLYSFNCNQRIDEIINLESTEVNHAKRMALIQEAMGIYYENAYAVSYFWLNRGYGVSDRVVDWQIQKGQAYLGSLNYLTLK